MPAGTGLREHLGGRQAARLMGRARRNGGQRDGRGEPRGTGDGCGVPTARSWGVALLARSRSGYVSKSYNPVA
ncbi:hypothetical protein [Streptomyces sp. NPDC048612]|uniref:hypothetical protein n=1 Tax=Streptomyces sp. NPDC048612 TaxID=3365579 RepID=UPI0037203B58